MIKTYVKKPIVIEAIQWNGENVKEIIDFCGIGNLKLYTHNFVLKGEVGIKTLEDGEDEIVKHIASIDDYIIKGIEGEFYPCKPDIFHKTYSEVTKEDLLP